MLDFAQSGLLSDYTPDDYVVDTGEPWKDAWLQQKKSATVKIRTVGEENTQLVKAAVRLWSTEVDRRQLKAISIVLRTDSRTNGKPVLYRRPRRVALRSFRLKTDNAPSAPPLREVGEHHSRGRTEKFSPSIKLTRYWVKGLRDHLNEMDVPSRYRNGIEAAFSDSIEATAEAFAVRLQRIFAVIGNRQRYNIEPARPITSGQGFSLPFQHQIIDRIPVRPDQYGDFFALFHDELMSHLTNGGFVKGSWGRLVLRHSEIYIESSARPAVRNTPGWQRAKILE
jgi:hypothetical protein